MVHPEIKDYDATAHVKVMGSWVVDPDSWTPRSLEEVDFNLTLHIGPKGKAGADLFYVQIATPEALRAHTEDHAHILGHHHVIVMSYHWPDLLRYLKKLVASCAAETWAETAMKLSRHFEWEYEDHQFATIPAVMAQVSG